MNDKTYNNLKPKQQLFIQCLYNGMIREAEDNGEQLSIMDSYPRSWLKMMSAKYCDMTWAPAWVVKDKSRQGDKGSYSMPELTDYHHKCLQDELPADDGETVIIGTEVVPA